MQVKSAGSADIPFLAMGGRHAYGTTLSALNDGLAIDLSKLKSVTINNSKGTVTVGGGATIRDVINTVANAGWQIGRFIYGLSQVNTYLQE